MDLGSSLFERDLFHRPLHELDTSAMLANGFPVRVGSEIAAGSNPSP
jgi:hypothetical protein